MPGLVSGVPGRHQRRRDRGLRFAVDLVLTPDELYSVTTTTGAGMR